MVCGRETQWHIVWYSVLDGVYFELPWTNTLWHRYWREVPKPW